MILFSYDPAERKAKRREKDNWCAPEHQRLAQDMVRDYPRDHNNRRIPGKSRELLVDNRPAIMVPPRKPISVLYEQNPKKQAF